MSMVARQIQHQQQEETKIKKRIRIRPERARVTKGEKAIVGAIALTLFLLIGFIIHNYATIYELNRDVYRLETSINEQSQVNEGLSLQVVELSAPDRILQIATERLNMSLNDHQVKVVKN
ncbi:cell division protein FtsL [Halalkalibacter urbisdiaboli]|uniref:cell division protein FtsL n=1 Tax=Halalkalibacter urbisdiaboli TaxID=1960589 RepID=UPI000B443715|nr:cell division protein FtsL [Halalkalibacter urbisdiaboli]